MYKLVNAAGNVYRECETEKQRDAYLSEGYTLVEDKKTQKTAKKAKKADEQSGDDVQ